jgi:hypothetical protein
MSEDSPAMVLATRQHISDGNWTAYYVLTGKDAGSPDKGANCHNA